MQKETVLSVQMEPFPTLSRLNVLSLLECKQLKKQMKLNHEKKINEDIIT